jgi:hypothetical protein
MLDVPKIDVLTSERKSSSQQRKPTPTRDSVMQFFLAAWLNTGKVFRKLSRRILSEGWNIFTFYIALILGRGVQVLIHQGFRGLLQIHNIVGILLLESVFPVLSAHPVIIIPAVMAIIVLGIICHHANTLEFRHKLDREIRREMRQTKTKAR